MSNYVPPTAPMNQPPYDPHQQGFPPQPQPPKSKSKVWLWVLGGCGMFVLLGVILVAAGGYFAYNKAKEIGFDPELMEKQPALAAAKIMAAANPDIEIVSVDEDKGLITIKEKSSGKTVTINLEEARDGRISVEQEGKEAMSIEGDSGSLIVNTPEGSMRMGSGANVTAPDWLPAYPGAEMKGLFEAESAGQRSGGFGFTTPAPVAKVMAYYEEAFESAGMRVTRSMTQQAGSEPVGQLYGASADQKRVCTLTATPTPEGTQVNLTFQTRP